MWNCFDVWCTMNKRTVCCDLWEDFFFFFCIIRIRVVYISGNRKTDFDWILFHEYTKTINKCVW